MKFNMHKASILRKLHSQFPVLFPPHGPSESYLPWHRPPPTYPHQNKAIWIRFFTTFQRTEKNLRSQLPLKFSFHTAAGAIVNENKRPLTDMRFYIMNKTPVSPRNRREIDDPSLNTAARTHERALIGSTTAEPGRRGKQGTTTGMPGKGQWRKRPPRPDRFSHLRSPSHAGGHLPPAPSAHMGQGPLPTALRGGAAKRGKRKRVSSTSFPPEERPIRPFRRPARGEGAQPPAPAAPPARGRSQADPAATSPPRHPPAEGAQPPPAPSSSSGGGSQPASPPSPRPSPARGPSIGPVPTWWRAVSPSTLA